MTWGCEKWERWVVCSLPLYVQGMCKQYKLLMDSNVLVKRLHMLLWIALRWKSETKPYYYTAKLWEWEQQQAEKKGFTTTNVPYGEMGSSPATSPLTSCSKWKILTSFSATTFMYMWEKEKGTRPVSEAIPISVDFTRGLMPLKGHNWIKVAWGLGLRV